MDKLVHCVVNDLNLYYMAVLQIILARDQIEASKLIHVVFKFVFFRFCQRTQWLQRTYEGQIVSMVLCLELSHVVPRFPEICPPVCYGRFHGPLHYSMHLN